MVRPVGGIGVIVGRRVVVIVVGVGIGIPTIYIL